MKLSRIIAIARKEVMHILRDPFTAGMALGLPIVLVIYFGFAIDFDFRGVKLAVYDFDNTRQSRELADVFLASGYFKLDKGAYPSEMLREIESEKDFGSIIINPGFGKKIASGQSADVQILIDGTDNQKTGIVARYIGSIQKAVASRFTGPAAGVPVELRTRFLYNPELNTRWFIVPGLIVIVIGLLAILMTALTVAREWENGSMELLLSTPVQPMEIVLGKIMPYVAIGVMGASLVYLVARLVFGVPFEGSHILLVLAVLIFIVASLAQGILISVTMRVQSRSMQFAFITGLLPSLLLSGFIFPVESMPVFFRYLTALLPPRWFMTIIRALFLKGPSLYEMILPFSALFLLSLIPIMAASKKFKKDLEP
ncbi:MAG: ABC transporter permease [Elusimicrobiota bacterium]